MEQLVVPFLIVYIFDSILVLKHPDNIRQTNINKNMHKNMHKNNPMQ